MFIICLVKRGIPMLERKDVLSMNKREKKDMREELAVSTSPSHPIPSTSIEERHKHRAEEYISGRFHSTVYG